MYYMNTTKGHIMNTTTDLHNAIHARYTDDGQTLTGFPWNVSYEVRDHDTVAVYVEAYDVEINVDFPFSYGDVDTIDYDLLARTVVAQLSENYGFTVEDTIYDGLRVIDAPGLRAQRAGLL